jgi:hypothetical protein
MAKTKTNNAASNGHGIPRFGNAGYIPIRVINDDTTISRSALLRLTNGGMLPDLDIDSECRYTQNPTIDDYYKVYMRQGLARRVVGVFPDECWQMEPEIFETEDVKTVTGFEEEWEDMDGRLHVLSHLQTADETSGIGQFGVVLLGFDDGKPLNEAVAGMKKDGTMDTRFRKVKLIYLRSLSQKHVTIGKVETDMNNPRYGQPVEYNVIFADPDSISQLGAVAVNKKDVKVHWSRVIHLAENPIDSLVLASPRLEPVYDRVYDVRKILGANGQGYWQTGFPGFSIETQAGIDAPDFDKEATKEEVGKFLNTQQRALFLEGLTAKALAVTTPDPKPHYDTHLQDICIAINVPMRIFKGSEEAKLASSQDQRTWNKRVRKRQIRYVNPFILRAFFDRMFLVGALTKPKKLFIEWPDLNAPTENDRATTAQKITEALVKYIAGNVSSLMGPREFLILVMGFPQARVDEILKVVGQKIKNLDKLTKVATTPKPAPAAGKVSIKSRGPKKAPAGSS